jgi:hypothetical protein
MSAISAIYKFAVAIKGGTCRPFRKVGRPHSKLPDSAVLDLRREYEAAPVGGKYAVVRKFAARYEAKFHSVHGIATYRSRSNPNKPLDPSLERAA